MSRNKLVFEDDSKKLVFEYCSPKLVFEDAFKKLVFDALLPTPSACTGIGSCVIGSTFTVG